MNEEVLRQKVVAYIGISKKTEYEVIKKLKGLKATPSEIHAIISDLKKLEYINDADYVKAYIRQNVKFKKYSIYEIYNKLLQKGIKDSIIELEIDKLSDSDYEEQVVDNLIKNKLKNYDVMKCNAYLYRRGFKSESYSRN